MNKFIILGALLWVSCNPKGADKPKNLIPEEKMAQVLYELSVINASRGFRPVNGEDLNSANTSFFDFHGVDSLQFAASNAYYAARPKLYLKIMNLAEELMDAQKDSLLAGKKIQKMDSVKLTFRHLEKQPNDPRK